MRLEPGRAGRRAALPALALALSLAAMAEDAPSPAVPVEASEAKDRPFDWDIAWKNWHGLDFQASRKTGRKGTVGDRPLLDLSETQLAGSIGGRIEVDGAAYAYATRGSLSGFDDGFDLRRARITVKGTSPLVVPFSYHVDLGYVPGSFTVTQAYVAMADVPHLGNLQFGQFTPPVGLQLITSSWDIGLMEPAAPLQALAPPPQPGVQASDTFFDRRGTWTAGALPASAPAASTAAARSDSATSWAVRPGWPSTTSTTRTLPATTTCTWAPASACSAGPTDSCDIAAGRRAIWHPMSSTPGSSTRAAPRRSAPSCCGRAGPTAHRPR
jgi:phosphate-selective porin